MAVMTEYGRIVAEIERKKAPTAKDRAVIRWFMRSPPPQPDPYVWHDIASLIDAAK